MGAPRFSLSASGGPIWFRDAENRMPTNFARNSAGEIIEWNAVRQEEERGSPLFETGQTRQLTGSWSGATNQFRYFLSGLYQKDEGIEPNNSNHQASIHANLDIMPAEKLTVATSLNYVDLRAHLGGDNGASAEGTLQGTFNELISLNGMGHLETPEFLMSRLDKLGGPESAPHYAVGWAHARQLHFSIPTVPVALATSAVAPRRTAR